MAARVDDIVARMARLEQDRTNADNTCQEIRDYVSPALEAFTKPDIPGQASHEKMLDSTPEQAHELLAAAIQGMISNPSQRWALLKPMDDRLDNDEEVQVYLEDTTRRLFGAFYSPDANLPANQHELYLDLTLYGLGGMYISERPGRGLLFQTRPRRELYVAEGAEGRIDTVFRPFKLTARQAMQRWPDLASDKIRNAMAKPATMDDEFEFIHAVYPREGRDTSRYDGGNMPIASCWVARDEKILIGESGYWEMPYVTPRWSKRAGEKDGRGPGHKALRPSKLLQRMVHDNLIAVEIAHAPPLARADDGVMSRVRWRARGITTVGAEWMRAGKLPIVPMITGAQPQVAEPAIERVRQQIEACFYNHLLQMFKDPRMTATQVIQIAEETLRVLGPVLGRLQTEKLGPMIGRSVNLLYRMGAFLPPPPQLIRHGWRIEYSSPIARAQKLSDAKGIVQTLEVAGQLAQGGGTEIYDNFDMDDTIRTLADLFGMPKNLLRPSKLVAYMRSQRGQARMQQLQLQNANDIATGIKNAAAALPLLRAGLQPASAAEAA